jgi:D-serine deaminase-like pyridoxal phosphate-dependent protein
MSIEERLAHLGSVPDTPALLLDAAVLRDNIERMARAARDGGKDLRPMAKTHKMPEVARLQLAAGAVGLQVAKLGEAEVFLGSGAEDVFISYPIVGDQKIRRLLDLAERSSLSVSLDALDVAQPLGRAARERGMTLPVLLEVDTGLQRVGVPADEAAATMALRIASTPGLTFKGVMTHQGHAYAAASVAELESMNEAACRALVDVAASIRRRGLECPVVSVGSSATARFDVLAEGITEVRPGTYVFNDATQVAHGASTWEQVAVWVVATVVSRPGPDRAVVDSGSKVLSADLPHHGGAAATYGRLMGTRDQVITQVSEEHGVVSTPPGSDLRIGDRVAIVPNHICPVVNLADEVFVAEDGRIAERWLVAARGKVQ